MSLVFFDLDRFKILNDEHGHSEGDRVLEAFSAILVDRTRRMDLSARWGGEEFVEVLVDCDAENAEAFADFVRQRLSELDFGWGQVSTSAGVVPLADGMDSPEALVAEVDRALYAAKQQGRNRICRTDSARLREIREAGLSREGAATGSRRSQDQAGGRRTPDE